MGHRHQSALHTSVWRLGKVLRDEGPKIFQIETTLNTTRSRRRSSSSRSASGSGSPRPRVVHRDAEGAVEMPTRMARKMFFDIEAPHQMTSVQAGDTDAVHARTLEHVQRQQLVPVEGQTDILTMGIPFVCPYNPDSIMNPILVMCMGSATCSTCTATSRSCARGA
jgi:hypothetical protein